MPDPRCLLTVHAHPDDEASKGAATVAKYHAAGVRTVLVCCTGGEEGEILNPAMDNEDVRANLADVRGRELDDAARIIGYDVVERLGYRDSGMPGSPANDNPDCFARAPADEATGRLVALIRRERPQVVVTYGDEQSQYPHPDHLRVHDISVAAFDAAGDAGRFPDAGEPYAPAKLYYTVFSVARFRAMHEKFAELGLESPFDEQWRQRWEGVEEPVFTTSIETDDFAHVRPDALRAHATQVDPTSPFWFGLPPEVLKDLHASDEYVRARSRVPVPDGVETDLFAGVD
jgi:mycothiol S-conjugate amidase